MKQNNEETMLPDELVRMRMEYAALKDEMSRQKIVNDTVMERILKKSAASLNINMIFDVSGSVFFIVLVLIFAPFDGPDRWTVLSVVIFLLLMAVWGVVLYRKLGPSRICQEDILTAALKVRKFRRNYIVQAVVSYVMTIVLLCVFIVPAIPAFSAMPPDKRLRATAILCVIVFLGAALQYFVDRKVLGACDDIIHCLDDKSKAGGGHDC